MINNEVAVCPTCDIKCSYCSGSIFNCNSCAGNRLDNPPQCTCDIGYYDVDEKNCY